MLNWSMSLSFQACSILMGVKKYEEYLEAHPEYAKQKRAGKLERVDDAMRDTFLTLQHSHFVTHCRVLRKHGLLLEDKKIWGLTRKGKLVSELIEIEFEEAAKSMKQIATMNPKQIGKKKEL
jgi:hypothetical protein